MCNNGKSTINITPLKIDGNTFVFGAARGRWFKMTSVDAEGVKIENRYMESRISLTPESWKNAHRGGSYSAKVMVRPLTLTVAAST